jgi:hypothetical protein
MCSAEVEDRMGLRVVIMVLGEDRDWRERGDSESEGMVKERNGVVVCKIVVQFCENRGAEGVVEGGNGTIAQCSLLVMMCISVLIQYIVLYKGIEIRVDIPVTSLRQTSCPTFPCPFSQGRPYPPLQGVSPLR